MVRSYLAVAGVAVAGLGLTALLNCGGTSSTPPGVHAEPPDRPASAPMPDGTGSVTFAIKKLYLGDTDPNGMPDKTNGWKSFGYDLDGKISTADSTDLCKCRNGASPKNVYPDGNDGIDNSFGKLILPIILGISSGASQTINQDIAAGKFTIMFDMQKLGTGTDYNPMTTNLFAGGDLMGTPKFDGTDKWPVLPELLNDGMTIAGGSKVSFPRSFLTKNTWVSGGKGDVTLSLSVSGYSLSLTVSNAVISMQLAADHKSATNGIIAGVLNTEELTNELQMVAGNIDSSLCTGPTIMSILDQITQASDILHDGTQDPSQECDGISIGLGFDAAIVELGSVLPPTDAGVNKCADAGG